jgi:hypothetical protein
MGERRCIQGIDGGNLRERDNLEDLGIDGRIILTWIFKKCYEGLEGIDVARYKDRWWAVVNAVMNFRGP